MTLKLVALEEAIEIAWRVASSIDLGSEEVHVTRCVGRVLSEDVTAPYDVPRFDVAVLDGYATKWEHVKGADVGTPRYLRVTASPLEEPFAVRVRTGERMPWGTDVVIPMEAARLEGDMIRVVEEQPRWRNIDRAGSFFARGSVVLRKGRVLRPLDIPVLSELGLESVKVRRQLKTKFISIVARDTVDDGRSICNDYSYALAELFSWYGAEVGDIVSVENNVEAVAKELRLSAEQADLIVTVGSASVGEGDVVRSVCTRIDGVRVLFHGINIYPGKPTGLVSIGERTLWLILPASIVAALAGTVLIGSVVVRSMLGISDSSLRIRARCGERIEGRPGSPLVAFLALSIDRSGELVVKSLGRGVNNLFVAMNADVCSVIPPRAVIEEGELIEVIPVRPLLLS